MDPARRTREAPAIRWPLTLGVAHAGFTGSCFNVTGASYYSFTIPTAGTHAVGGNDELPSSNLYFYVYDDSGFQNQIAYNPESFYLPNPGTYYLKVWTPYSYSNVTYDLIVD